MLLTRCCAARGGAAAAAAAAAAYRCPSAFIRPSAGACASGGGAAAARRRRGFAGARETAPPGPTAAAAPAEPGEAAAELRAMVQRLDERVHQLERKARRGPGGALYFPPWAGWRRPRPSHMMHRASRALAPRGPPAAPN